MGWQRNNGVDDSDLVCKNPEADTMVVYHTTLAQIFTSTELPGDKIGCIDLALKGTDNFCFEKTQNHRFLLA